MRSRVMPGSLVTMERRVAVRRLNSVDLPTLGRPTITIDGILGVMRCRTDARVNNIIMIRRASLADAAGRPVGRPTITSDGILGVMRCRTDARVNNIIMIRRASLAAASGQRQVSALGANARRVLL